VQSEIRDDLMVNLIDEAKQSVLISAITDTSILDQSVEEVLGLMLGVPVSITQESIDTDSESTTLTAVIGLAGALSGAYTVLAPSEAAIQMTACMMGMEVTSLDETTFDGLGEITNMLAGAWKSKIASLNAACLLSVPTVVTGTQYEVHKRTSAFRLTRSYRFDDNVFTVSIYGENP
jgi:chemotaxis protein CheX